MLKSEFLNFEASFHTMLKMQPETTEAGKINHFQAHLREEALQIFRNISGPNRKIVDNVLIVLRRKHVKPESLATTKHNSHKFTLDLKTKSLYDFFE